MKCEGVSLSADTKFSQSFRAQIADEKTVGSEKAIAVVEIINAGNYISLNIANGADRDRLIRITSWNEEETANSTGTRKDFPSF